jgi:hypothetical protein
VAIAITQAGTGTSTTSSTTFSLSPTVSFSVNDTIVVCSAYDNLATGTAPYISSVTDSKSNTYTGNGIKTSGGTGSDRATCAIYSANITTALSTSDTITITFTGSITAKAVVFYKVSTASGKKANRRVLATLAPSANITSLTRISQSMVSGEAVIMALAIEDTATVTGDSDTLAGSWSSSYSISAVGASATESMQIFTQTKIVNAGGSQTWNTSFSSADTAAVYAIFEEVSLVTVFTKTATGSGSGTSAAATKVTQYRLARHTDFSFPYRFGGRFYIGPPTITRTATGAGNGTQTSTRNIIYVRVATGSGTGTSNNTIIHDVLRTAYGSGGATAGDTGTGKHIPVRTSTGTGTSSSDAAGLHISPRTAMGDGLGTSTILVTRVVLRTSSGEGEGTSTSTRILTALRTATGGGTGSGVLVGARTRRTTATGSGIGAALADWDKSHIFRVPITEGYPFAVRLSDESPDRLFAHTPQGSRAKNLYRLTDGSYTTTDPRRPELITRTYFGGHDNFLTAAEITELTDAGYGSSIT